MVRKRTWLSHQYHDTGDHAWKSGMGEEEMYQFYRDKMCPRTLVEEYVLRVTCHVLRVACCAVRVACLA